MNNQEKQAIENLEKYNQHHIVEYMEKLDSNDKEKIIEQINDIDLEETMSLYNRTKLKREKKEAQIQPLETITANKINQLQKNEYIEIGEKVLQANKFAVVTMAGGQGTRLRT